MDKRKPNGYWPKPENFYRELKVAIKENNGEFPTQGELIKMGRKSLVHAMLHYHGGANSARKKMGFPIIKNSNYHWTWKVVKRNLEVIIEKVGGFPSQKKLTELGENGLAVAIVRHQGGFSAVRKKMGYEYGNKPRFYYRDWNNFERDIKKIIKQNKGKFPSWGDLSNMRRTSLANAISLYHGGYYRVRERMGYEEGRKPDGYWQKKKNIMSELKIAIRENNGEFPTYNQLAARKKLSLYLAIKDTYGGLCKLRSQMGFDSIKPKDYWINPDNFYRELNQAIKKNDGEFPSQKKLGLLGLSSLGYAIVKFYGGFPKLKMKMGYELSIKPTNFWRKWENFEKEMKKAIELNNGEFPYRAQLCKMNQSSLAAAMDNYGGIYAVREKIGYNELMRKELAKGLEEIAEKLVG